MERRPVFLDEIEGRGLCRLVGHAVKNFLDGRGDLGVVRKPLTRLCPLKSATFWAAVS